MLRELLSRFPTVPLVATPSLVEAMPRLAARLGAAPHLLIKRDDAIAFGFGGNKVRKLAFVAARAKADGADTLITAGGVQSNHARATAAAAAKLGMRAILVANGAAPARPTANALLDGLLGAEVVHVSARDQRAPKMTEIADRLRAEGRQPFVIPIGASTPLGALGYVNAVAELVDQIAAPDVIIHSTSSGGTQAGLVAGCRLLGLKTRVIGISADESAAVLQRDVEEIVRGIAESAARCPGLSARPRAALQLRHCNRSGRSIRRRRLRHSDRCVARSDRAGRAHRGDLSRSDLHRESDGRVDRVRAREEIRRGPDRVVLAHRRTSGTIRLTLSP